MKTIWTPTITGAKLTNYCNCLMHSIAYVGGPRLQHPSIESPLAVGSEVSSAHLRSARCHAGLLNGNPGQPAPCYLLPEFRQRANGPSGEFANSSACYLSRPENLAIRARLQSPQPKLAH